MLAEIGRDAESLRVTFERERTALLFSGEYDNGSAILSISAGAGGTEATDWAEMLLRMYLRWAERHRFTTEIVDATEGEETGLKSVTVEIDGRRAYGLLRAERGVHRLVRISPYDSQKRRQTTFALVEVLPEVDEDVTEIELDWDEIRIDTYRSQGAGGQHVNKTDSAVRLTHLPTGHRRPEPERAVADPEQGDRDQGPQGPTPRAGPRGEGGGAPPAQGRARRGRLGEPDPELRPAPLPDGQGPPDGPGDVEHLGRPRRRPRRLHAGRARARRRRATARWPARASPRPTAGACRLTPGRPRRRARRLRRDLARRPRRLRRRVGRPPTIAAPRGRSSGSSPTSGRPTRSASSWPSAPGAAGDGGSPVVGFVAAIRRGQHVVPLDAVRAPGGRRHRASGEPSSSAVLPAPAGRRRRPGGPCTDAAQPISNALYARYGIVPRLPVLELVGAPGPARRCRRSPRASARSRSSCSRPGRRTARARAAWPPASGASTGRSSATSTPRTTPTSRAAGPPRLPLPRPATGGPSATATRRRPAASDRSRCEDEVLFPASSATCSAPSRRAGAVSTWVPGAAARAVAALLRAGLRIEDFPALLCWDRPFAGLRALRPDLARPPLSAAAPERPDHAAARRPDARPESAASLAATVTSAHPSPCRAAAAAARPDAARPRPRTRRPRRGRRCAGVTKTYPNGKVALRDVDLDAPRGRLRLPRRARRAPASRRSSSCSSATSSPTAGEVVLDGQDLARVPRRRVPRSAARSASSSRTSSCCPTGRSARTSPSPSR